jgi:two-component system, LytTR family, response regulator
MTLPRIRALVVDDEPVARERMVALLREEPDVDIVGECADGKEAAVAIDEFSPDLVFLDVQIPHMNGLELAQSIGRRPAPAVVFVTAYEDYALAAFEIHALDYLLKPFSRERFRAAVAHAREHLARRSAGGPPRDRLVVKSTGRIYFVRMADIDWCEAAGNYVRLHVGSQAHLVRGTMANLEAELDPARFVRIHRSAIVNVDRIQELRSSFNGEYMVVLREGTRLTLSRGYRDALQTRLGRSI